MSERKQTQNTSPSPAAATWAQQEGAGHHRACSAQDRQEPKTRARACGCEGCLRVVSLLQGEDVKSGHSYRIRERSGHFGELGKSDPSFLPRDVFTEAGTLHPSTESIPELGCGQFIASTALPAPQSHNRSSSLLAGAEKRCQSRVIPEHAQRRAPQPRHRTISGIRGSDQRVTTSGLQRAMLQQQSPS